MGYGKNTENLHYNYKLGQPWQSRQKPSYSQTQYLCPVNAQKNFFRATYPGHFQQTGYTGLVARPLQMAPQFNTPHCLYEISPGVHFDESLSGMQKNFSLSNPGIYSHPQESYFISPAPADMQYLSYYPGQTLVPTLGSQQIPTSQITWEGSTPGFSYMSVPFHGKSLEDVSRVTGRQDRSDYLIGQQHFKPQDGQIMLLPPYNAVQDAAINTWPLSATNGQRSYGAPAVPAQSTHYSSYTVPVSTSEHLESTEPSGPLSDSIPVISQLAHEFVASFCPHLGQQPYCIPPVKRSRHPDKSSKLLVLSMESEKRVLGSFERFFGEHKMPVFMLCHYPLSGFLKEFNCHLDDKNGAPSSGNLVTLILLSCQFDITVVTVSIISGNSDFAYIQRAVQKSAAHVKRCKNAMTNWLTYLGIRLKVREVLAFPNLKKAMLQRIAKDKSFKQLYGNLVTLHVDDLSAPFEEEWSTPVHRHQFTEWMKNKVLCHKSSLLTQDQLQLLVGTLLSPRLSQVEYMKDLYSMEPISDSDKQNDATKDTTEDLSQLKLTIDGVMKTFDEFMDEYVLTYYPDVDTESYRVPPIHFNIQSLKNPVEYIKDIPHLSNGTACDDPEDVSNLDKDFMPQRMSYKWKVNKKADPGDEQCYLNIDRENESGNGTGQPIQCAPQSRNEDGQSSKAKSIKTVDSISQRVAPEASITSKSYTSPVRKDAPTKVTFSEVLKGVEILSDVMKKDTRADEGENRVISSLEYIASDQRQKPMFIICGYQYNNYLNKLREEMFSKGEANRPIRAFGQTMRAEHDCLIFHKKYGAIIVCIKAIGDNFSDWNASQDERVDSINKILKKALKQLEREEAMIHHVTSNLSPGLKCHRLIALPNMKREDVNSALEKDLELKKSISLLTNGRGADMFLCQDELSDKFTSIWDKPKSVKARLMSWWNDVVDSMFTVKKEKDDAVIDQAKDNMTPRVYRQIIGRYCGLLSTVEVWSPNNPRVEVRSASEAASVCAKRFAKLVLMPHQVEVLCSNHRRLFLYGPPGSGKTLLLILKAREWLLSNRVVIILNVRPGSMHGYPYAYGVYKKLKKMLEPYGSLANNLHMYNIDSLTFKSNVLSQVLPTSCVIIDEVTPATHPVIEHLCCLQVQYLWCAGAFEEDCPYTARGFHTCKMDKILRCPPIVQTLLKYTEESVRGEKPYWNIYQSTFPLQSVTSSKNTVHSVAEKENKCNYPHSLSHASKSSVLTCSNDNIPQGKEKNSLKCNKNEKTYFSSLDGAVDSQPVSYDPDSLNKRLMDKYSNKSKKQKGSLSDTEEIRLNETSEKNLSWYTTSSVELGLATDGPRPHIIDHQNHSSELKYPLDCHQCAEELARFLLSLVRTDGSVSTWADQRHQPSKNKHTFKPTSMTVRGKNSKPAEMTIFSNTSAIHTKQPSLPTQRPVPEFNSKALLWTDVLIVVKDAHPDSVFLTTLSRRGIPVECAVGGEARKIEQLDLPKLYVTTYKEVSGLERTLVVFVPSEIPDQRENQHYSTDLRDLQLSQCIQRYTDQDKLALWFVASRSLSSLVLILP
ncbi:hypothetical protein Btru_031448 [Bulinus truncatus]|nr:hypothetical protein Btru_031448 [Bulinus truncatus]